MGLILNAGISLYLIKAATIAFISIGFLIFLINYSPFLRRIFPDYTLQLGGLIGNTSFLGIPIANALIEAKFLPDDAINLSVGFDLGTTLFAWIFGPFFLQENASQIKLLNIKKFSNALISSPASKGIIGVLIAYLLGLEEQFGNWLSLPTTVVINLAILVVGTRLGIITNNKNKINELNKPFKYSILLKLLIFPSIIFFICKTFNFGLDQATATVIQSGTPSAISTILMAEAYKYNQATAAQIVFSTTLISFITMPILALLVYIFY